MHRGNLHGVFLQACKAHLLVTLRTNAGVAAYAADNTGAMAVLETGERIDGAALIGTDGLWSLIKAKMPGDGAPRMSGHAIYCTVISHDEMQEDLRWAAATLWAGPKSRAISDHFCHPTAAHDALCHQVMSAKPVQDRHAAVEWFYGSTGLQSAIRTEAQRDTKAKL